MSKITTLSALADYLGLSSATVSRALAGHEKIALKTRQRVQAAAQEVGYVPNRTAQALATGRSGFVGFLLPMRGRGMADPFLGEFISALTEEFNAQGVELLLSAVPKQASEQEHLKRLITSGRVDGIVLSRIQQEDERVALLQQQGIPYVTHGRLATSEQGYSWLDTDGENAFSEAFKHLYALGHRHFGMLSIEEQLTFKIKREQGLLKAIDHCSDAGVSLRVARTPRFDDTARQQAVHALLSAPNRPTAILAVSDGLALDVIEMAKQLGMRIPEDVSVIGFDNRPLAQRITPTLSTFDGRISDSALALAKMLLARIHQPDRPHQHCLLQAQFISRESHGPAPVT